MSIDPNAFTFDDDWYREGVEFEAKANFDIQIGGKAPPSHPSFDPERLAFRFWQVRLISILYGELRSFLEDVDVGAGYEAATCEGQRRIWERIQNPTPEQQQYFDALVDEHENQPEHKPYRAQLRPVFCALLTPEDWQAIADTATGTIRDRLLQQVTERSNVA